MAKLTPDQRNYYYLLEAGRAGIHKPILAALHQAHLSPSLEDGETGLGIMPVGSVSLQRIDTFPEQVQYAANTLRALTDNLARQGWQGSDLWNAEAGRYSDSLMDMVASGYQPGNTEVGVGRLEPSDRAALFQAYQSDMETDYIDKQAPRNLANLDRALLSLMDRIPQYYTGLAHQRDSLLEAVRIWRKLDTLEEARLSLAKDAKIAPEVLSEAQLDVLLKQFMQRLSPYYGGYPHQREALLRLTQLWRTLPSREDAIASLEKDTSPNSGLEFLDPALIHFVEQVPKYYAGAGTQRNSLTEAVRFWRKLDSRSAVMMSFGIDPKILSSSSADQETLRQVASQLDRELLGFIRRIPGAYNEAEHQRESLIRMVQLWRGLATRQLAISALTEDLKRLEREKRKKEVPVVIIPKRPDRWTRSNIILSLPVIPDGSFTWAEATKGGTRMPPNQTTVDAIVRISKLAQRARDRVGRPFIITSWYRPPHINRAVGGAKYSRHIVGDAIDFVCENLTGNQLYWLLDPWWPGGLGRYRSFPNLCHIDARNYRARWRN
ncbi:peptidase M15A [Lusitaniella coriacea LEGE 07157]|uniref:Peptidase M15A n=1 Tax=Lusitaniella coriacea LEGE 07157 TaxID=945747 RepID=A0A8J7JFX2_9CYAN|nr:D-Ala-D-Ala carboxypeptidase family metallohydrolase [Lusitaniella coriacea]MBE9119085.1 peptidase M15A [Lusitaniella coriacea LEGE 07157]